MSASATLPKSTPLSRGDRFLAVVASLMLLVSTGLLVDPPSLVPMTGGLAPIGQLSTDSNIRRRHARRLQWFEETGEIRLFRQDFVYTPPGATAQVKLDDVRVIALPPDTLIQFDEMALRDLEIALKEAVVASKPKPPPLRVVPMARTSLRKTMRSIEGLTAAQFELDVKVREFLRHRPEILPLKRLRSDRLSFTRLSDFQMRLLSPAAAETIEFKGPRWIGISWSRPLLDGVTYELELARDNTFKRKIPYRTKSTSLKIQLTEAGRYFWRIRARRGAEVLTSPVQNFALGQESRGAAAAPSEVTARGAVVNPRNMKKGGAYSAEIARDERFTDVVRTDSVSSPSCLTKGLKKGSYHCRVRTLSGIQPLREYDFQVK